MAKRREKKGRFGAASLPRAGRYLPPRRRRTELAVGLALVAVVALVLGWGIFRRGARVVARAPVSSAHATFEGTCGACHDSFAGVSDDGCLACHERFGASEGVFTAAAHASRTGTTPMELEGPPCATCHAEHRGRDVRPVHAADATCGACHGVDAFGDHPELAFARDLAPGDPPEERTHLRFPHRFHVDRLRAEKAWDDPQRACLYCHRPEPSGAGFEPLGFDRACGECHLASRTGTGRLPLGDPADPEPGVLALDAIRSSGEGGTRWAFFANPGEYRVSGGKIQKRPVYHADPWVLENLRRIRRVLYPDAGLSTLLPASLPPADGGDGQGARPDPLVREAAADAVDVLRALVAEARSRPEPEVADEVARLEALLDEAESRLARGEGITESAFALPAEPDPSLGEERVAALQELALDLTEPCRRCHVVTGGAILRTQRDQKTLRSARFDHRAHVLLVPLCTDCHAEIPSLLAAEPPAEPDPRDRAETLNLPRLDICRSCHGPTLAADSCTTCHRFHPRDPSGDLVVYAPPVPAEDGS